jgi:hypothetical protein
MPKMQDRADPGPPFRKAGRFPLYHPDDLDGWIAGKLSDPVTSTSALGKGGVAMSAIKASSRRHSARHRVGQCDSCRRSFNNAPLAPMLQDAVWCKLAAESEILCAECCFKRAYERDIDLTRANLRLCVLNLAGWPFSYFNLFREAKRQSSERAQHLYERYLKTWGVQDPDEVPHQRRSRQHKLPAQQQQGIAL